MSIDNLPSAAQGLGRAASEARAWVGDIAPVAGSVANEAHALITTTRRAENLGRRLSGAAGRRPCVGVFGPSQAGKSYLVSALARRPGSTLICDFAGTPKDFLRDINPPGDRESTGLVTRFTTARSGTVDPAFPVELRLLSETDIVKILANAYFSDFDANNLKIAAPNEAALRAVIAAAEAEAAPASVAAHLDEIVLFDLGEYFERYFPARIETLRQTSYWEALIRLGGRLSLAGRARLYAPLWGGIAELTSLFLHLAQGLEQLGHAPEARAAIDALVPREASIIDVFTLKRLRTPEDAADTIAVQPLLASGAGGAVRLPRALLASLVAELKIVMTETAWPFLGQTDLLDFPGARSREKMIEIASDAEEQVEQVRGLLLRGKIAYLFQRFTEERELTAMLLCMPNNPAEVKDLAAMVRGWIGLTHGDTPAERASVRNALFLVLTKFDLEFIEKGGETSETRKGKWDRRLYASFLELYGRDGWPADWDGKPFANTLFLRNPGMKQEHLMSYAEIKRLPDGSEHLVEGGIAPAKAPVVAEYRDAFLTSEITAKHFANREAVWEAALSPNDGGISFLVDRLTNTIDERLKAKQIGERLSEQARVLHSQFRRFYHADDDAGRKEKDLAIQALRRDLFRQVDPQQYKPFLRLIAAMALEDRESRECFLTVAVPKQEPAAAEAPAAASDPWADDPWAEAPAAPVAAPAPKPVVLQDRPAHFARDLMNLWADKLRRLPQAAAGFGISGRIIEDMASEMIVGANRLNLGGAIADVVRRQTQAANVRWDDVADRAANLANGILNDFVADLGFGVLPAGERPKRPKSDLPIFAPPPIFQGLPSLGDHRQRLELDYFLDWATGLHRLALDNVSFGGGREIDDVGNARLGRILDALNPILTRVA
ncbi:virulence factor SrfC family protein [Lacibacterium aquatile]|uniref:Virulence factor SrfC family protein n=1 Tax=Lacibacterium aquatile TaxID=1168082 RepID=A0ABW5DWZ2_9PROT